MEIVRLFPRNTTHYVQTGTKFYRLASRKLWGIYGTNLQNIEKMMRRIYWADLGMKLCQVDQAGAEALIVAYLCENGNFRSLFVNGVKPHVFVAMHVFAKEWQKRLQVSGLDIKFDINELLSCKIPDLKKHPFWKELDTLIRSSDGWSASERFYYMGKQICHSSNYGITSRMFCLNLLEKSKGQIVLPTKEADRFLGIYHDLFPEIRRWHVRVERQVRETRLLYNILGYPIYFSGDFDKPNAVKEMFAAGPQSAVAGITRLAYTRFQNFIETYKFKWDILADTHDSYLAQCPESEDIECLKIMKQLIEIELKSPVDGTIFNMRSEGASGYNWGPYKEDKNPKGLKEVKL